MKKMIPILSLLALLPTLSLAQERQESEGQKPVVKSRAAAVMELYKEVPGYRACVNTGLESLVEAYNKINANAPIAAQDRIAIACVPVAEFTEVEATSK